MLLIYIYIYIYMHDPHYQAIGQTFDNHYTCVTSTTIYSITMDYGELYFPSMVRQPWLGSPFVIERFFRNIYLYIYS